MLKQNTSMHWCNVTDETWDGEAPAAATVAQVYDFTMELANTPKLRPRTKHLAVQLHHFRQYILNKMITVEKVDTKYQRADIMTKALPRDPFQFLRKTITGW